MEHSTPNLRSLGGWHHCKWGKKDQGCGCGKPPPGPCGCDLSIKDYGCGCDNPGPGDCGCGSSMKDYGCGCGKPGPGSCGCDSKIKDLGCGCGKPAPGKCGCKKCRPRCAGQDNHIWLHGDQNKCIQYDSRDPERWVEMGPCNSSNFYQKWYFDQGCIKSVQDSSMCLAYKEYGHSRPWLYVTKCTGWSNQQWGYENNRIRPMMDGSYNTRCVDLCRDCGDFLYLEKCESSRDDDQKFLMGNCCLNYNYH